MCARRFSLHSYTQILVPSQLDASQLDANFYFDKWEVPKLAYRLTETQIKLNNFENTFKDSS